MMQKVSVTLHYFLLRLTSYVIDIDSKNATNTCKLSPDFFYTQGACRVVQCTLFFFLVRGAFYASQKSLLFPKGSIVSG